MNFTTKYNTITRENIHEMVVSFYTKILKEENEVTQVFKDKLGDNLATQHWIEHINILINFWAMIGLQEENYHGNPLMVHFDLPLTKDMFSSWLMIFFEIIDLMYEPNCGMVFKQRAQNISQNFIKNLDI